MPSVVRDPAATRITKFTNCRVVRDNSLVEQDLWVDAESGRILRGQEAFYGSLITPDQVIDLDGRIVAPGFIDVQLNGSHGFDFSAVQESAKAYQDGLRQHNRSLVKTGVTSYLPTLTSQRPESYHKILPHLGPSGWLRSAADGAESLGAHCEGPFFSPRKHGVHNQDVILAASGFSDIEACYGAENINPALTQAGARQPANVKKITAAPEIEGVLRSIPALRSRGIICSIGHSDATYEEACAAADRGATMITHLFNAMRPFGHRNPGIFGLLGREERTRPFFGIIADGIHLHPTSIKIAFNAHPEGLILVTDAIKPAGLPDGLYEWTNGDRILKRGPLLTLENSDTLAGSSISLLECVNNFLQWTGATIPQAINAVTSTPAAMLDLAGVKGSLASDADADLVVLGNDGSSLTVDQVWKFGTKIFDTEK